MSKNKEKKASVVLDPFQIWAHRWGRLGTAIALVYMIALPFVVLGYYGCIPAVGDVLNIATLGILLVYIPVGISEALSYTPILGASSYLTFITGNIMNLKLPCAVNALKLSGKEQNTPEGEAVQSLAVGVCSIMTIAILAIAAAFSGLLSPILELQAVKTASDYIVPALFGSLCLGMFASSSSGSKVVKNGVFGVLPVVVIVSIIAIAYRIAFKSTLFGMVGFLILAMLPIALICSYVMWRKGIITVVDKDAPKADAAADADKES